MEKNINKIAYEISKLDSKERDNLIDVLTNKYGIFANIYPYPVGIIPTENGDNVLYDVYIKNTGRYKLQLLKTIKEFFGLGLKEAKDILDSSPCLLKEDISFIEAENMKKVFEECGATIEIM